MKYRFICLIVTIGLPLLAQHQGHDMAGMTGMDAMDGMTDAGMFLMNQASGTSMNPQSAMTPMIMTHPGSWNIMYMGNVFLTDTQQSGPRGGDKFYAPNWFMGAVEHSAGEGSFLLQAMTSLDPATITHRRYPELFQTGETAFGKPIVDGQHPHDLIMSLGLHYAHPLGEDTTLQVYFAPVGDPALGPVAFPHRASASELPQAVLGHHWQDSTHIANEVLTVGIMHKKIRLEASGFYGSEPNENRWNIDYGPINSWSTRFSVFPTKNWMAQASVGRLARPERQEPGDVVRTTASVHYSRPLPGGSWSSSFVWGRNHKLIDGRDSDSYLAETVFPIRAKHFITGRVELTNKDELFSDNPALRDRLARTAGESFRIGAYTAGYTRDFNLFRHVQTGIGANASVYALPTAIKPYYGDRPFGVNVFLRLRLRS